MTDAARLAAPAIDLGARCASVLRALPALGPLIIETPNDAATIESCHDYAPFHLEGEVGRVDALGMLLRLRLTRWSRARVVDDGVADGARCIEFIDTIDRVVHRVRVADPMRERGFDEVVRLLMAEASGLAIGSTAGVPPLPRLRRVVRATPTELDHREVRAAWFSLVAPQDADAALRELGITRGRMLQAIGHDWARQVPAEALGRALTSAIAQGVAVAITVGNAGCMQTCWGPWRVECPARSVLTAIAPSARVLIRDLEGSKCWIVREPRPDLPAWCLEAHDAIGDLVLSVDLADPHDERGAVRWKSVLDQEA